jgi:hypothetical protein
MTNVHESAPAFSLHIGSLHPIACFQDTAIFEAISWKHTLLHFEPSGNTPVPAVHFIINENLSRFGESSNIAT